MDAFDCYLHWKFLHVPYGMLLMIPDALFLNFKFIITDSYITNTIFPATEMQKCTFYQ